MEPLYHECNLERFHVQSDTTKKFRVSHIKHWIEMWFANKISPLRKFGKSIKYQYWDFFEQCDLNTWLCGVIQRPPINSHHVPYHLYFFHLFLCCNFNVLCKLFIRIQKMTWFVWMLLFPVVKQVLLLLQQKIIVYFLRKLSWSDRSKIKI